MLALLLTLTVILARDDHQGPHYRDNNENGPLDKDSWDTWNGLWRSFLRTSLPFTKMIGIPFPNLKEDSQFIVQGLRDKDGNPLINRFNIFNWSQFRCLPTEAGRTANDNCEWLETKLEACEKAEKTYDDKANEFGVMGIDSRNKSAQAQAEEYQKLRDRANAAIPLLRRVKNYFVRKAWAEQLFAYTEASYKKCHIQLQYCDPWGNNHNYSVSPSSSNSRIVFERASSEECDHCPDKLVLSEQFANKHVIYGFSNDNKPHGMNLKYHIEHGWRVTFLEGYGGIWRLFNDKDCTVKFLNFQDAGGYGGQNQTMY